MVSLNSLGNFEDFSIYIYGCILNTLELQC